MSAIVIQTGMVLTAADGVNANNPLIGYENRVTTANISADTADADYPVTNLANPATNLYWLASDTSPDQQVVTVVLDTVETVDYVGIAKHNFSTEQITVALECQVTSGAAWTSLMTGVIPPDDGPLLFRFTEQSLYAIRVRMSGDAGLPRMAVLYVGKLLVLQRRMYVGHTPITLGRVWSRIESASENGHYLGTVLTGETRQTAASLANLTPSWYRSYFDPFVQSARDAPFFFAWRPGDYPFEVGYAWLSGNAPAPTNQRTNGMMQVNITMQGVA